MGRPIDYSELGVSDRDFYSPFEAVEHYKLFDRPSIFGSSIDRAIYENGIAQIEIPVTDSDFKSVLKKFDECIEDDIPELSDTHYDVDRRFGNDAGYVRKDAKVKDGVQYQDAKSYLHINEGSLQRWQLQFSRGPAILQALLTEAHELQQALIRVGRSVFTELEETHPNIAKAYFPGMRSHSFLRLLSYDGYETGEQINDVVAKKHYDIGGATIQAYADAPGFWGNSGPNADKTYYDTNEGHGFLFMGRGHTSLYGNESRLQPLYHGVDRINIKGQIHVPRRHAVILFINAPDVDYRIKPTDTLPELYPQAATA